MEALKSYTDLVQSRALTKILPHNTADHIYERFTITKAKDVPKETLYKHNGNIPFQCCSGIGIPCWSLSALLSVLPFDLIVDNKRYVFSMCKGFNKNGETYAIKYSIFNTTFYLHLTDFYNNPIDACVEMIVKLNELNLL